MTSVRVDQEREDFSLTWRRLFILVALALLGAVTAAGAQPVAVPDTWGGDIWSRSRLTGSWGGLRDAMGKRGVMFDADLQLIPQGVLDGGRDTAVELWGTADYTLNMDTQKLGLWPGGFLRVYAASSFGESLSSDTGALVPANTAWLLQIIEPALRKTLSSSGRLTGVDTAVVAGLRLYARF
jgi:porin